MAIPSPTSRSGTRVYLSLWDLFWAVVSPILALYLRDPGIVFRGEWDVLGYYWLFSSGFALVAFVALRLQDGMTRYFSVHEALDIAEAALFTELMTFVSLFTLTRLEGIPRSMPLTHGLLLAAGLIAARMVVRVVFSEGKEAQDYHSRRERIILIGANRFASSFIQLLKAYTPGHEPVIAVLDQDANMIGRAISGVQVLGAPHELDAIISEFAIHGVATDRVVIAGEADFLSPAVLQEIKRVCKKRQVDLSFLPRMIGVTEQKLTNLVAISGAAVFRAAVILLAQTLDRCCWIAYIDRAFIPHSDDCGCAGSFGSRSADSVLAGASGLERTLFPNLQISNLTSAV
jgi:FlaA1/EpsC-like NDP-sugar epimerase